MGPFYLQLELIQFTIETKFDTDRIFSSDIRLTTPVYLIDPFSIDWKFVLE